MIDEMIPCGRSALRMARAHFSRQPQFFVDLVKKVAETETSNIGFDIFNVNFSWCA